jgi:hypothetical protein
MGMRMMLKQDPDMKGAADDALLSMQRRAAREGRQDAYDMTIGDVEDSFEFWHELQSTLRERASQLGTPTRTGTSRRAGGMVGSLRDDLMGELTDPRRHSWGPAYEKATLKYRQSSEVIEALKDSAEFAKTDPADLRKIMSGLSDEERTAFATGTVADLLYKVAGQSDTSNQARSLMKSTRLKENLAVLLGEGPAAKLIDRLEDEAKKLDTYKKVTGNSATSIRQAMSEVLGENPGAEFVNEVLQGNMLGAAKAGVSSIMPNNAGTKTMDPRAAESILDMMMITDPMKLNRAMAELESQRQGLTSAGARILPGLMGGLGSTTQQEY